MGCSQSKLVPEKEPNIQTKQTFIIRTKIIQEPIISPFYEIRSSEKITKNTIII